MATSVTEDRTTGFYMLGDRRLVNIHDRLYCVGRGCVIHHPSEHHLRHLPLHWLDSRAMMVRTCPHGTDHPDPDDLEYRNRIGQGWMGVHSCDGCC